MRGWRGIRTKPSSARCSAISCSADWRSRTGPVGGRREIVVHRRIDRYTDAHPDVVAARALFPDGLRRYAGIVLDVHFDHLLARDWPRWDGGSLAAFTARVYNGIA